MAKYTHSNIIIDPTEEGIESLIGKEVYFDDQPYICLENANKDYNIGILEKIFKDSMYPFQVKTLEGEMRVFACIIVKKEEPKKYVPFESITEFLDAYRNAPGCLNEEDYYLPKNGIWLKGKASKAYYIATKIWDIGVFIIGDLKGTTWEELLEYYTFLDGSQCGKLMEETNG